MTNSTETDPKNASKPQLVKLDKALRLAEQWVSSMSTSKSEVNGKSVEVELEGRPARLGIGATAPKETVKESNIARSSDALERKIMARLQGDKRRAEWEAQDSAQPAKNGNVDEDSEDDLESKTKSFTKKRPLALNSPIHPKKKHR